MPTLVYRPVYGSPVSLSVQTVRSRKKADWNLERLCIPAAIIVTLLVWGGSLFTGTRQTSTPLPSTRQPPPPPPPPPPQPPPPLESITLKVQQVLYAPSGSEIDASVIEERNEFFTTSVNASDGIVTSNSTSDVTSIVRGPTGGARRRLSEFADNLDASQCFNLSSNDTGGRFTLFEYTVVVYNTDKLSELTDKLDTLSTQVGFPCQKLQKATDVVDGPAPSPESPAPKRVSGTGGFLIEEHPRLRNGGRCLFVVHTNIYEIVRIATSDRNVRLRRDSPSTQMEMR